MKCISNGNISDYGCDWIRTIPSFSVFVLYGLVIPIFGVFGCMANGLNAIVFMRPKMTASVFTYLSILSWVDSLCCIIIVCICISRTVGLNSFAWIYFDLQLQSPLFGSLSGAANWILAAVTMDRIIYLCHRLPQTQPKFCTRSVARRNVCGIILISTVLNGPYYFMFKIQNDGSFYATDFYQSKIYKIHNWFSFAVLCIIPGIFLLIGNIAVVVIFRRWVNKSKSMSSPDEQNNAKRRNRQEYQLKLTITIIIVVFLYIFGELPGHITSRRNAVNLIFGGDSSKIDFEKVEKFESFFLTLNVIQLSFNIIVYAVINPSFMEEFFIFLRQVSNSIYSILGLKALRKCCGKKEEENLSGIDEGFARNSDSNSYDNQIFTIEDERNNNSIAEIIDTKRINKARSCLDLKFEIGLQSQPEELFGCGRILQRHSMSF